MIACEESQRVCYYFRLLGFNAYSCDLSSCSGGFPEWHIKADCSSLLNGNCQFVTLDGVTHYVVGKWDMIIAFPPCTYLSKAGARWMFPSGQISADRFLKAEAARDFFNLILNADCDFIAIENPVPLKIVSLPKPSQIIQPFLFGEPFSKKTLLWLKGLPLLIPTNILSNYSPYIPSNTSKFSKGINKGSKGFANTKKDRSKTFLGVAEAMAFQWGEFLINNSKK